jgi:hypothetical protein
MSHPRPRAGPLGPRGPYRRPPSSDAGALMASIISKVRTLTDTSQVPTGEGQWPVDSTIGWSGTGTTTPPAARLEPRRELEVVPSRHLVVLPSPRKSARCSSCGPEGVSGYVPRRVARPGPSMSTCWASESADPQVDGPAADKNPVCSQFASSNAQEHSGARQTYVLRRSAGSSLHHKRLRSDQGRAGQLRARVGRGHRLATGATLYPQNGPLSSGTRRAAIQATATMAAAVQAGPTDTQAGPTPPIHRST